MIDVYNAVSTVYALAEAEHRVATVDGLLKWHKSEELRFCRYELHETLNHEASLLARAFRDYIAVTAAGECRHARELAGIWWKNFPQRGITRDEVYDLVHSYSPTSLMRESAKLFTDTYWRDGYGGKAWGKIAQAGLLYDKTQPLLFLDHVVDLSHNGGLFLDKGVIFDLYSPDSYRTLLDTKTYSGGLLCSGWVRSVPIHDTVYRTLVYTMRLLRIQTGRLQKVESPYWEDDFVEWENNVFVPETVESEDIYEEEEEEYEEEESSESFYQTKPAR